jgi:major membrane immunogen (membrane-anchored lipoprotein)
MKMKNRITILIAFVISSMLVASCSKKDTTDNTPQPKETFISYKYNGVVYKSVPSTLTSLKTTFFGQTGTNPIRNIYLYTPVTVTVGSFPIVDKASDDKTFGARYSDDVININGVSGTIKITLSDSQYIEGTFEFSETVNNVTKAITEGSFRALK